MQVARSGGDEIAAKLSSSSSPPLWTRTMKHQAQQGSQIRWHVVSAVAAKPTLRERPMDEELSLAMECDALIWGSSSSRSSSGAKCPPPKPPPAGPSPSSSSGKLRLCWLDEFITINSFSDDDQVDYKASDVKDVIIFKPALDCLISQTNFIKMGGILIKIGRKGQGFIPQLNLPKAQRNSSPLHASEDRNLRFDLFTALLNIFGSSPPFFHAMSTFYDRVPRLDGGLDFHDNILQLVTNSLSLHFPRIITSLVNMESNWKVECNAMHSWVLGCAVRMHTSRSGCSSTTSAAAASPPPAPTSSSPAPPPMTKNTAGVGSEGLATARSHILIVTTAAAAHDKQRRWVGATIPGLASVDTEGLAAVSRGCSSKCGASTSPDKEADPLAADDGDDPAPTTEVARHINHPWPCAAQSSALQSSYRRRWHWVAQRPGLVDEREPAGDSVRRGGDSRSPGLDDARSRSERHLRILRGRLVLLTVAPIPATGRALVLLARAVLAASARLVPASRARVFSVVAIVNPRHWRTSVR
uniref:Uncharacterized protein n=1 Tax=Oryza glumipatula TaxID=40148 RepID=A0A0E0ADK3_9ORYZ